MVVKCHSIQELIDVLQKYEKTMQSKNSQFIARLLNEGFTLATNYVDAISPVYKGDTTISIGVEDKGKAVKGYVYMNGKDVAFIEFGAGVTFNGSAGTSPHPKGEELGLTIGSYGKGQGANSWGWWFRKDERQYERQYEHSYGNPAYMPLYRTLQELKEKVADIAIEVYGGK